MQYGNKNDKKEMEASMKFRLNRTMQYGNYINIKIIIIYKQSLNRTMQYGNFYILLCFYIQDMLFKSYYVVWKR